MLKMHTRPVKIFALEILAAIIIVVISIPTIQVAWEGVLINQTEQLRRGGGAKFPHPESY